MHAVPPLSKIDRETKPENTPKLLEQFVQGAQIVRREPEKPFGGLRLQHITLTTWLLLGGGAVLTVSQFVFAWFAAPGLALLTACLVGFAVLSIFREEARATTIGLSILPLAELVRSSIITRSPFQSAAMLYATLLVLALPYRYMFTLNEPLELSRIKLKGHLFGLPLMLMLGECLGLIGYAFLRNQYPYQGTSLALAGLSAVVFAFAEEMLLRGLIQQQASRVMHPLLAAGLAAALYVPLATSRAALLSLGPAIAMGVVLATVYHIKHNLLLSTAINAAAKLTYMGLVVAFVLH